MSSAAAVAWQFSAREHAVRTYLSAVLLVGLVLNATLGWSWADPIAALVIAAVAGKEGRDAWQGKGRCAPTTAAAPSAGAEADQCACRPGCENESSVLSTDPGPLTGPRAAGGALPPSRSFLVPRNGAAVGARL